MEEIVNAFFSRPQALSALGDDLADVWLETSWEHGDLVGGIALEACTRLVLAGNSQEYGLLDQMRRLRRQLDRLDEDYAMRLVRALGALAEHFPAPHLPHLLEQLLGREEVAEDAAFELGMLALRAALEADGLQKARHCLLEARRHFTQAHLDEERADARAFATAVDALLAYSADLPVPDELGETLRETVLELRMNLVRTRPGWRTPRIETLDAWQRLTDTLTRARAADEPRAWLHAGAIMDALVSIYTAHRTLELFTDSEHTGLHSLISPRVQRTLLTHEGGLALLEQWLDELGSEPETDEDPTAAVVREQANTLRQALLAEGGDAFPKPDGPAVSLTGLGLTTADTRRAEELFASAPELAIRLNARVEAHQTQIPADEIPLVDAVYRRTQQALHEQCPEGYVGQFAADIDRLLLLLLRFLVLRLEETQSFGGDSRAYLRHIKPGEARPKETELGKDLRDFLGGLGLRVLLEVSHVGAGRVDILWRPHDEHIVLELKRDWTNPSWEAYAASYLTQTVSYQAASQPISFLIVLDLTDKSSGLAAVPACVEVRTVPGAAGDTRRRTAIMMRIQGNKRNPSDLVPADEHSTPC
ncbi:hypothetical protein GCM10023192_69560 [Amycolatopsis samaneae]